MSSSQLLGPNYLSQSASAFENNGNNGHTGPIDGKSNSNFKHDGSGSDDDDYGGENSHIG